MNAFIDFWSRLYQWSPFWTAVLAFLIATSLFRLTRGKSNLPRFYTRSGNVNRYYKQWPR